ncbi:MAG TPA: heparan-alpha-glucosaminide N-acetyltransferase domain-containing protein [Vicinamibacterales bacterium]|nr:heparan-alpha-glucosaminide N-acetyltransferase domain-containing protein [Vicinamibacterales bacterium]
MAPIRAGRKAYLDWLRGVAVVIMVTAHVTDSWTRLEDHTRTLYMYTVFIAGLAAPLFLFLAGLTLAMAACSRALRVGHSEAAAQTRKRALQIFALAFLFRLQSQLLGWGPLINFLKVDILNVMGIAMIAGAIMWGLSSNRIVRIALFAIATTAIAMTTPLVREAGVLAALPDAIEAYIRPMPGRTTFALFPWSGFLLAGAIAGELVFAARTESQERRLQASLLAAGLAGAVVAHEFSFRTSIYPVANFWTSSPTFFFIRLGFCTALVPIARAVEAFHGFVRSRLGDRLPPGSPGLVVTTLGRSSLFVYWIHVEMAYGAVSLPLKHALPLEISLIATVALLALLYQITKWKDRTMAGRELKGVWRFVAPVLK